MKLAIIGSRTLSPKLGQFDDVITAGLRRLRIERSAVDAVVSGGAEGVDLKAKEWAKKNKIEYVEHLPDYGRYGSRRAPLERNVLIANDCDALIALWDGDSTGTMHCAMKARKAGKPTWVARWVESEAA